MSIPQSYLLFYEKIMPPQSKVEHNHMLNQCTIISLYNFLRLIMTKISRQLHCNKKGQKGGFPPFGGLK